METGGVAMFRAFRDVLAMMAPWLLGGFAAAGVVGALVPRAWVERVMGAGRGARGIVNAVLLGVPLPVCSCGVLPLAAGLRKAGAGKGATAGFLIATPQTGLDSIAATYALMGPVFAAARPLAALATGLLGGFAVDRAGGAKPEPAAPAPKRPCCCHCHGAAPAKTKAACCTSSAPAREGLLRRILRGAFVDLLGDVARPLTLGLAVAAAVTAFVPAPFVAETFGGRDLLAMPAMALLGFPMYVCSTASIPIAASLVAKGVSPGAAFVFLMVGPAINAASVATVAQLIGRRAMALYAAVIVCGAMACGMVVNALPFDVLPQVRACCAEAGATPFENACGVVLALLIAYHLVRRSRRKGRPEKT